MRSTHSRLAVCPMPHRSKMVFSTARGVRVPRLPIHRWRVGSRDCMRQANEGGQGS